MELITDKKCLYKGLGIAFGVEIISGLLTMNSMSVYRQIKKPALSPPEWVFPIVWTILFALMGISSAAVCSRKSEFKRIALTIYGIQLLLNLMWSIVFFNYKNYGASLLVLLALLHSVAFMIQYFYKISPKAAALQIPYLLWILFAGYLNTMIYLLNR